MRATQMKSGRAAQDWGKYILVLQYQNGITWVARIRGP